MKISTLLLLLACNIANYGYFVSCSKLDPVLAASLTSSNTKGDNNVWDIVVEMEGDVNSVIDSATSTLSYSTLTRGERATLLSQQLIANANQTQKDVFVLISNIRTSSALPIATSSWITNSVFINGANEELIQSLTKTNGVAMVRKQIVIQLEVESVQSFVETSQGNGWNIEKVGAPELWSRNYTGLGVIVGHIDSGVSYTHTALRTRWVGGAGGWHDPAGLSPNLPYESDMTTSHGTHTLATAVGRLGVGIAPDAKWMSCRGCLGTRCSEIELISCGEFMTCPRRDAQSNCAGIPNIVTNSWGGPHSFNNFYDHVIRAWRNVGIIPVFASGNSGPNCSSVNQPCNNKDVICVGAVSQDDRLASFSSVGPSLRGDFGVYKPDIVAPGVAIRSATALTDNSFGSMDGTSMATPAVAGGIALLLSANPTLTFSGVKTALLGYAWRGGLTPVAGCDPVNSDPWPNQKFGYGRLRLGNMTIPPSLGGREQSSVLTTVALGSLSIFFFWKT